MAACHQLPDYLETHPDAAIWYHASDMVLSFDTDASYWAAKSVPWLTTT